MRWIVHLYVADMGLSEGQVSVQYVLRKKGSRTDFVTLRTAGWADPWQHTYIQVCWKTFWNIMPNFSRGTEYIRDEKEPLVNLDMRKMR